MTTQHETLKPSSYARILQEAQTLLTASSDLEDALIGVAHVAVPDLADWLAVDVISHQGANRRLIVAHEGPDPAGLLRKLSSPGLSPGSDAEDSKDLDVAFSIECPMLARSGVVGTITAYMAESEREFDQPQKAALFALAEQCGRAIENASLRDQAQAAARDRTDSLVLLQAVFGGSAIGLAFLDPYMRIKFANDEMAHMAGTTVEAAVGTNLQDLLPTMAGPLKDAVAELSSGVQKSKEFEVELPAPIQDNAPAICTVTSHLIRAEDDTVVGVGLVLNNITARRCAEIKRRDSEEQLHLALGAARMGLWTWDAETDTTKWSDIAASLLGWEQKECSTTGAEFREFLDVEQRELFEGRFKQSLHGEPYEMEFRVQWADGSSHILLSKGQVSRRHNTVTGLSGILLDVTEQRAILDAGNRLAHRQARAGEQAVRMQRVTSKLSEATSLDQIGAVLLTEGIAVTQASRAIVYLMNEQGQHLERSHSVGFQTKDLGTLLRLDVKDDGPISHSVQTLRPVLAGDRQSLLEQYPSAASMLVDVDTEGFAAFPLLVNGRVIGAWAMFWEAPRPFEEGELIIFLTLASQCAQAIERARIHERERFIATALQRTLLPAELPILSGAKTARRYVPSAAGVEVGGDWYDVLQLPGQRVALVIGDVGGHNIDAAAVMGQLRNAIRSYAWEGHSAAKVIEATNHLLCGMEPGVLATCCYVELNLEDGIAAVALAGHPPPLIVEAEYGSAFMDMAADPPLGAEPTHQYEQASLFLNAGQSLALYTDGLVETRKVSIGEGMEHLVNATNKLVRPSAETLADVLLAAASENDVEDDMALLVLQYTPTAPVSDTSGIRTVRRSLPSSVASAGVARRFASDVLTDWGAEDALDTVALCVSELVTNALIHTATDIELVLFLDKDHVRVEIIDQSDRMPAKRSGGQDSTTGRGLHIVEAISSEWGVRPVGSGKAVWFCVDRAAADSQKA